MRGVAVFMALMAVIAVFPARAGTQARLMADTCATCHLPEIHSTIPSLAGRPAGEMLRLLLAFRDGSRPATIMDRITRGYSREELGVIVGELTGKDEP